MSNLDRSELDVVYVNFFSAKDVITSIYSLKSLLSKTSLTTAVYIVDNSFSCQSIDSTLQLSELPMAVSDSSFHVHYQPSDYNLGFGSACNKAAFIGTSSSVLFVNCDTDFKDTDPQTFLDALRCLKYDDVAIVGPKVVRPDGLLHSSCFSFDPVSILLKPLRHVRKIGGPLTRSIPFYFLFKKRIDRITYEGLPKDNPSTVDWLSGCCLLVCRSFFSEVSGFDPRFFLYFEDVDLCRKARQLGLSVVFYPSLSVIHTAKHSSSSQRGILRSFIFNRTARYHLISWIKYMLKWRYDFARKMQPSPRKRFGTGYNMNFSSFDSFRSLE